MKYTTILNHRISKLTLGTAQLGYQYGVANRTGKPDNKTAQKILDISIANGVNCLDTAHAYGDSENVIGSFLSSCRDLPNTPIVVSKLTPIEVKDKITFNNVYKKVRSQVRESLRRLQLKKIPIYLLHRATDVYAYDGLIMESLLRLQEEGFIGQLGLSVYSPEEAQIVTEIEELKAIQVPINILDQRMISSGMLNQLCKKNTIIFARSLFLQGLFFIKPDNLAAEMEFVRKPLTQLNDISSRYNITLAEMAIAFVRDLIEVTSVVIGAETPEQVLKNIKLMSIPSISQDLREELMATFTDTPARVITPSLWGIN